MSSPMLKCSIPTVAAAGSASLSLLLSPLSPTAAADRKPPAAAAAAPAPAPVPPAAAADAKDSGPVPAGYKKGTGSKLSRSPSRVYCSRRARPSSRTRLPSRATETLLLRRRNRNAWSCE